MPVKLNFTQSFSQTFGRAGAFQPVIATFFNLATFSITLHSGRGFAFVIAYAQSGERNSIAVRLANEPFWDAGGYLCSASVS